VPEEKAGRTSLIADAYGNFIEGSELAAQRSATPGMLNREVERHPAGQRSADARYLAVLRQFARRDPADLLYAAPAAPSSRRTS
jgi:hypothetical protein